MTHKPPIRKKKQKEKSITFRIKTGYSLELLMSKETKLLGSTESKTTKYENGENAPHSETTELESWTKYLEDNRENQ